MSARNEISRSPACSTHMDRWRGIGWHAPRMFRHVADAGRRDQRQRGPKVCKLVFRLSPPIMDVDMAGSAAWRS